MTMTDVPSRAVAPTAVSYIRWGPVIAGSIAAAALAFVLHAFAGSIGIAVSSTAPTWRDSSLALWLLSGLYLLLVAIVSYGLGGYIAGRARGPITGIAPDEVEVRDGGHGLIAWALATLLTGLLALGAAQGLTRLAAPSSGASGTAASVGGENIVAYDLDKLFRSERRPAGTDMSYTRSEAARILLTAAGHTGMTSDDRSYLIRLVAARTGLAGPEAERRTDTVIASARENIAQSRRSATLLGFMAGAAALLGAAVAWFAACAGGRHSDGISAVPMAGWSLMGPRLRRLS
jgi:hypothetical protein